MKIPNEIGNLGGVHGNEPFGITLVKSLTSDPISGAKGIIANERAAATGARWIDTNLVGSTNLDDDSYEGQRLRELKEECAQFEWINDFHNTNDPAAHELWVLPEVARNKPNVVKWMLGRTGIRHLILDLSTPFHEALPPFAVVELGLPADNYEAWENAQLVRWRRIMGEMGRIGIDNLEPPANLNVTTLEFAGDISRDQAQEAGLGRFSSLRRYQSLPAATVDVLGLPPDNYRVLSWAYRNSSNPVPGTNEREYWGEITRLVPSPF